MGLLFTKWFSTATSSSAFWDLAAVLCEVLLLLLTTVFPHCWGTQLRSSIVCCAVAFPVYEVDYMPTFPSALGSMGDYPSST